MTGFAHDIAGGQGNLIAPSVQSPNFNLANPSASPNPSWALLRSGILYAVGLVLSGGTITGTSYIINTSGAFFYSGTPAAGNLVASVASTPGTDGFGNAYQAGFTAYSGGGAFFAQLAASELSFSPVSGASDLQLVAESSPQGGSHDALRLNNADFHVFGGGNIYMAGGDVIAIDPNNPGTPETWHDMTPGLLNGWTVTAGQVGRYRLMPDNSVWLDADLTAGTLTSGTNVWTPPSGYIPGASVPRPVPLSLITSTAAAARTVPFFAVGAHLQTHNFAAGDSRVIVSARYTLDA